MLLTVTATGPDADALGFLLHKHPGRVQEFGLPVGTATVFYPEASPERTTAALLLEVDPVALVSRRLGSHAGLALTDYVTDRPYAASSLLAVALGRVFNTALNGRCDARPDAAATPLPLTIRVPAVPARPDRAGRLAGAELVRRLFEPLGWAVDAIEAPLGPDGAYGTSPYVDVTLTGTLRLADALTHLYVLLPVLDNAKHYWVGPDEVTKLVRRGEGWLADHPERARIVRRYLAARRDYVEDAVARLVALDDAETPEADSAPEDDAAGEADAAGVAHAVGEADAAGVAHAVGEADAAGVAHAVGEADAAGVAHAVGEAHAAGVAHAAGLDYAVDGASAAQPVDSAPGAERVPAAGCGKFDDSGRNPAPDAPTTKLASSFRPDALPEALPEALPDASAEPGGAPSAPLKVLRRDAVLATVREVGARRVVDLGCGEGYYLRALASEPGVVEVLGVDVAPGVLAEAERRLERLSERQRAEITLAQSSVTYRDDRLTGFDALLLVEVIEHLEPDRLDALEASVFGAARPAHAIVTTPNREYNARYGLDDDRLRHHDHRFEWTRVEFASWAAAVAGRRGYRVEFRDVGEPDPELGPPTQLALFTREDA